MPRPQITTRRLMIAVAVIALSTHAVLWCVQMRNRSTAYRKKGDEFALRTMRWGSMAKTKDGRLVNGYVNENDHNHDIWAWEMAEKYRRLSYYPWLPLTPDPPPPRELANPRSALDLSDEKITPLDVNPRPPAWTFLWTWWN